MSGTLFTIFGVLVSILGLGLLILVHELGHFLAAKTSGVGVTEFALGFGKKLFKFKKGETEYSLRAIPFGGLVNMVGFADPNDKSDKSYTSKSKITKLKIILAGVIFNLIFAIIVLTSINMYGVKKMKSEIVPLKDSPAAVMLVSGDEVTKVNDVEVLSWDELSTELKKLSGQPVNLTVLRDGEEKEFTLTPVKVKGEDEYGAVIEKWVIGVYPAGKTFIAPGLPVQKAFLESMRFVKIAYVTTYAFIGKLFVKKASAEKGLAGPITIITLLTLCVQDGFFSFFYFLAVISLMLAVMNSMPIPILDGGHALFLGIEAVVGRPLNKKVTDTIQMLFFYLLILLMLFATYLDIGRLLK
jgi:regulator of sigma E protease